jgi:hypothetical protein
MGFVQVQLFVQGGIGLPMWFVDFYRCVQVHLFGLGYLNGGGSVVCG